MAWMRTWRLGGLAALTLVAAAAPWALDPRGTAAEPGRTVSGDALPIGARTATLERGAVAPADAATAARHADPPAGDQSPSSATMTADASSLVRAVVHIQSDERAGSGFVAADGRVLTSYHVVGDATTVTVWFPSGATRHGTVVASDPELDVAVVAVPRIPRSVVPLDWASGEMPALGTPLWAWGYPLESAVVAAGFTRAPTVTAGIVSAHRARGETWFLQTDAALTTGNSGGPVTTADGVVVAISTLVLTPQGRDPEGLNFAVDLTSRRERILALLEAGAPGP